METPQPTLKSEAKILRRLAGMAERLGLSSNQAILIYAGNAGFLNLQMTTVAVNILQKIAVQNGISLDEDEPFIIQLIKKGVIEPQEVEIFGWRLHGATKTTEGQTEKDAVAGSTVAIGPNGDGTKTTKRVGAHRRASASSGK